MAAPISSLIWQPIGADVGCDGVGTTPRQHVGMSAGRIKRVPKVERPGSGDDTRHWGPPWTLDSSSYFESANRSKKSIALDLDKPADLEIARRLALRADVACEGVGTTPRQHVDMSAGSHQARP